MSTKYENYFSAPFNRDGTAQNVPFSRFQTPPSECATDICDGLFLSSRINSAKSKKNLKIEAIWCYLKSDVIHARLDAHTRDRTHRLRFQLNSKATLCLLFCRSLVATGSFPVSCLHEVPPSFTWKHPVQGSVCCEFCVCVCVTFSLSSFLDCCFVNKRSLYHMKHVDSNLLLL